MSPKLKRNSERINVFFTQEIVEWLKKQADLKGTTVSGIVRMIVLEHIGKQEGGNDT